MPQMRAQEPAERRPVLTLQRPQAHDHVQLTPPRRRLFERNETEPVPQVPFQVIYAGVRLAIATGVAPADTKTSFSKKKKKQTSKVACLFFFKIKIIIIN